MPACPSNAGYTFARLQTLKARVEKLSLGGRQERTHRKLRHSNNPVSHSMPSHAQLAHQGSGIAHKTRCCVLVFVLANECAVPSHRIRCRKDRDKVLAHVHVERIHHSHPRSAERSKRSPNRHAAKSVA